MGASLKKGDNYDEYICAVAKRRRAAGLPDGDVDAWVSERLKEINGNLLPTDFQTINGSWLRIVRQKLLDGCTISIHFDITELKNTEKALQRAKEQAELASRSKSEFLANISHELRTPLNAVIGYSDALKREIFGRLANEKQVDYLESIHASGNHLLSLIEDILDVSAIEAGKLELISEKIGLSSILAAVATMVGIRADTGGVSIINSVGPSLPKIYADQRRVKQIITNLLSNAVKFTPPGGTVTITGEITNMGELAIAITDTGVGMSQMDIKLALETFGRVNSSKQNLGVEGTGLGLPLVKGLIEMHGGRLEIESEVNVGTTGRIVFPKDRVAIVEDSGS